jgi:uncharacterized protein YukE
MQAVAAAGRCPVSPGQNIREEGTMGNGVDADPDEMLEFVRALREFNGTVAELHTRLTARFMKLSDTWKDADRQRFAQQFELTTKNLRAFVQFSEAHIPVLTKKAEHLKAYQRIR